MLLLSTTLTLMVYLFLIIFGAYSLANELQSSTIGAITHCIENNPIYAHNKFMPLTFPADAEQHYQDILNRTQIFREFPMHDYGYSGPWIENYYIHHFLNKPLEYFKGFIPLFIQFVDTHCYEFTDGSKRNFSLPDREGLYTVLSSVLRHDVLYLALSQDDQGITMKLFNDYPNILVLSAGGYGHIPIPLVKGYIPHSPTPTKFNWDVGFYGNVRPQLARGRMLMEMENLVRRSNSMSYHSSLTHDWIQSMQATKFNLAPRGFGRTSFRLAEIIQSGGIPVYMYDDVPWIPYAGSNVSVEHFGYIGQMGKLRTLLKQLQATTAEDYHHRREIVYQIRDFYTYDGIIKQIELMLEDPKVLIESQYNGSEPDVNTTCYLRCQRVPDKDHRRLSWNHKKIVNSKNTIYSDDIWSSVVQ